VAGQVAGYAPLLYQLSYITEGMEGFEPSTYGLQM
jgi:hypothetical protein